MAMLSQILSPAHIYLDIAGSSKKKVLQNVAEVISGYRQDLTSDTIFDHLIAREKLGSTGFGDGVAIPHSRLSGCSQITGAFFRLSSPVDFDAVDRKPVDLLFVLLVPDEKNQDHLEILSEIASRLSSADVRQQLRDSNNSDQVHSLLTD